MGLFARRHFDKWALVVEYTGKHISFKEAQALREKGLGSHICKLSRHSCIDGHRGVGGCMANDATGLPGGNNVEFFMPRFSSPNSHVERMYLRAIKDIAKGDEILVDCGKDFRDRYVN